MSTERSSGYREVKPEGFGIVPAPAPGTVAHGCPAGVPGGHGGGAGCPFPGCGGVQPCGAEAGGGGHTSAAAPMDGATQSPSTIATLTSAARIRIRE